MRIFALFLLAVLLHGCDSTTLLTGPEEVSVHFASQFRRDKVNIEINERIVYSGRVTTDDFYGFAQTIPLSLPAGLIHIRIIVNGAARSSLEFDSRFNKNIGVHYNREDNDIDLELWPRAPVLF